MPRKRKMTPKTTSWLVKSVESTWTSGATVTLAEVFYTKFDEEGDAQDGTVEDHDDFDFCCQGDLVLQMSAEEAPAAGAHIRLTIEQVA